MSDRVYVPGYGYVGGEDNTGSARGTGSSRPSPAPSGRERRTWFSTDALARARANAAAASSMDGSQRGKHTGSSGDTPSADPVASPFVPKPTTGVPLPLSGRGGLGQMRGYEFGQRLGWNPDALERFPYGVTYADETEATDTFLMLDADYQSWLKDLSQNPTIGTSGSTGRMLWERLSNLSAMRTEAGDPASPQQIAAELAGSLGVAPLGSDGSAPTSSSGSRSYGGGGYSGGGGGGGGQVSLTNPSSAKGLLMQTMQGALGRNPTGREYSQFLKILNEAEMANPQTVSVEGDVVVGSGGIDPGVLALEFAQDQEDFQERQGDGYFRTFMSALAGGV